MEKLKASANTEQALKLIKRTGEAELKLLIRLFGETRQLLYKTHREIAVIMEVSGKSAALAVDKVESVESVAEGSIMPVSSEIQNHSLVPNIAKRNGSDQFVYSRSF